MDKNAAQVSASASRLISRRLHSWSSRTRSSLSGSPSKPPQRPGVATRGMPPTTIRFCYNVGMYVQGPCKKISRSAPTRGCGGSGSGAGPGLGPDRNGVGLRDYTGKPSKMHQGDEALARHTVVRMYHEVTKKYTLARRRGAILARIPTWHSFDTNRRIRCKSVLCTCGWRAAAGWVCWHSRQNSSVLDGSSHVGLSWPGPEVRSWLFLVCTHMIIPRSRFVVTPLEARWVFMEET